MWGSSGNNIITRTIVMARHVLKFLLLPVVLTASRAPKFNQISPASKNILISTEVPSNIISDCFESLQLQETENWMCFCS